MSMPYTPPSEEPRAEGVTGPEWIVGADFSANDLPANTGNITAPDDSVQSETGLMPGGSGGMKAANESRGTDDYPN